MTREQCADCLKFGKEIEEINYGVVSIENLIDLWFDQGKIMALTGSRLSQTFTEIWNVFIKILFPLDEILNDQELVSLPYQFFTIFFNPDFFEMIMENF